MGRPDARRAALHTEHVHGGLRGAEEPAEAQEGADGYSGRGSPVLGQTAQARLTQPQLEEGGFLVTHLPREQPQGLPLIRTYLEAYENTADGGRIQSPERIEGP